MKRIVISTTVICFALTSSVVYSAPSDPITFLQAQELMKWFGCLVSTFVGMRFGQELMKL